MMNIKSIACLTLLFVFVSCTKNESDYSKKELVLSQNNLNALPLDLASYKNLKRLYADANQLKEISEKTFVGLRDLVELDLSYNQLQALPLSLAQATELEVLDLSDNQLKDFPPVILSLKKLRTLNIRNNQIKELPEEIKQLENLEIIYLAGNKLNRDNKALYRSWLPRTKMVWVEFKGE